VRAAINAADEPRPVLLVFEMGRLRLLNLGRERRWSYVGDEEWE
jgi:hypothetical protein